MDSPSEPLRTLHSKCAASGGAESARLSSLNSWAVRRLSPVLMTVLGLCEQHPLATLYPPRRRFVDEIAKLFGQAAQSRALGVRVVKVVAVIGEPRG